MTHFSTDKSREYTMNFIANEWLKTPADMRSPFVPTADEVEEFIGSAIAERPAIAAAGYPVALLAERGYRISVAQRNGLPVPDDEIETE